MSNSFYRKRSEYSERNSVELLHGGQLFFDRLLQMINTAKESIHIQVYIFDDDETGIMVSDALIAAAKRKVDVYVLVDGYASRKLSKVFIKNLRDAGIHLRFFEPFLRTSRFYLGRRLHHKIFVFDRYNALVGGVNISNNYNDFPEKKAWLDFAVCTSGQAALELCVLCWKTWNNFPLQMGLTPCEREPLTDDYITSNECRIALRRNDWVRRKNQVSSAYSKMLLHAEKEIVILCSYFLPGRFMRRLLEKAALRGVKIKLVTAGISDLPMIKQAERYMYDWLLSKGIEIFEYQPSILHGKLAIGDQQVVLIGSYNINNLSAYASIELNLEIANDAFAVKTRSDIDAIIRNDCKIITPAYHASTTNWFRRFKRWLLFGLVQNGLYLITFYYRHTLGKKSASDKSHYYG